MINLDERYQSYLYGSKRMQIDGESEKVKAYGYTDDGTDIIGHYVLTENYKLHYNKEGEFVKKFELRECVCQILGVGFILFVNRII